MTVSSTIQRVIAGIGGQLFVRGAVVLNALLAVPILLRAWGVETYGEWLVLTAIATYLSLSNFGLSTAGSMAIIQAVAAGDTKRALRIFQSTMNATVFVVVTFGMVVLAVVATMPVAHFLNLKVIGKGGAIAIVAFLTVQVVALTVKGFFMGATNAAGSYGLPNMVSGLAKMLELTALLCAVGLFHFTPVGAALTTTIVSLVDVFAQILIARRESPWAVPSLKTFDKEQVVALLAPSLGHALIYIGVNAIFVQGPRLVLAVIMGPTAVAAYAVYVTLLRTIDHATNLFTDVMQLEFARHASDGDDLHQSARLLTRSGRFVLSSYGMIAIAILATGWIVIPFWTRHRIEFDFGLLLIMVVSSFFTQLGRSSLTYLMGQNHIMKPSLYMLAFAAAGLGLGGLLTASAGVRGMAWGQMAGEMATTAVLIKFAAGRLRTGAAALALPQIDPAGAAVDGWAILRAQWQRALARRRAGDLAQ